MLHATHTRPAARATRGHLSSAWPLRILATTNLSIVGGHCSRALLAHVFFFIGVAAIPHRRAHFTGIHCIAVISLEAAMLSAGVSGQMSDALICANLRTL